MEQILSFYGGMILGGCLGFLLFAAVCFFRDELPALRPEPPEKP